MRRSVKELASVLRSSASNSLSNASVSETLAGASPALSAAQTLLSGLHESLGNQDRGYASGGRAGGRRGRGVVVRSSGASARSSDRTASAPKEDVDLNILEESSHSKFNTDLDSGRISTSSIASASAFRDRLTGKSGSPKPILIHEEDDEDSGESGAVDFDHGNHDRPEPSPSPSVASKRSAPPSSTSYARKQRGKAAAEAIYDDEEEVEEIGLRPRSTPPISDDEGPAPRSASRRPDSYEPHPDFVGSTFFRIKSAAGLADLLHLWRGCRDVLNFAELGYLSQRLMLASEELRKAGSPAPDSRSSKVAQWSQDLEGKKALSEILKQMNDQILSEPADAPPLTYKKHGRFSRDRRDEEVEDPSRVVIKKAKAYAQALHAATKTGARLPPNTLEALHALLKKEDTDARSTLISKCLLALCNAYAQLPGETASLMADILSRQLNLFPEPPVFQSVLRDCITSLHSLVRLGNYSAASALALKLETGPLAHPETFHSLSPRNISGLLWSYAHMERSFSSPPSSSGRRSKKSSTAADQGVLELSLSRLADSRGVITKSEAAYSLWALTKNKAPREITEKYFELLTPILLEGKHISPEALSMAVWSVGTFGVDGEFSELREQLVDHSLASLRSDLATGMKLSAAAASGIISGLGRLGRVRDVQEVSSFFDKCLDVRSMRVLEGSSLLWTWASLGLSLAPPSSSTRRAAFAPVAQIPDALIASMIDRLRDLSFKTELRAASTILWALAKMERADDFERLLRAYEPTLSSPAKWGKPEDFSCLSMLLWAVSQMSYDLPPHVLKTIQDQVAIPENAARLDSQEVSNILYFHANMATPIQSDTLGTLLDRLDTLLSSPTASSLPAMALSNLAWSISGLLALNLVPAEQREKALSAVSALARQINAHIEQQPLERLEATQLFHARMLLETQDLESALPLPESTISFAENFWRERGKTFHPSPFASKVRSQLMTLGFTAVPECPTSDGLVVIDLAIPELQLAVECDGPDHFVRNTRRLKGKRGLFVDVLLQRRGWKVLRVSYLDFDARRGSASKTGFIRELLEKEGIEIPGSGSAKSHGSSPV